MDAGLGLASVTGGGDDVDWDVVGGDEAGEVEELVEMTLCRKRDDDHHYIGLFYGCHAGCGFKMFVGKIMRLQVVIFLVIKMFMGPT